jgi:hypothetical protein
VIDGAKLCFETGDGRQSSQTGDVRQRDWRQVLLKIEIHDFVGA